MGKSSLRGSTIKRCMPVLDAVSQGYIIPAWCDIAIKIYKEVDEETKIKSTKIAVHMSSHFKNGEPVSGHTWEQVGDLCDLKKFRFGKMLLKFTNPWIIETSPGWSVQFKNPSNNFSNNIELLEGVVDTDEYYSAVNFPFVWTGSDEGEWVIPAGTPLVQVIPFERTNIEMEVSEIDKKKQYSVQSKLGLHFIDRYKRLFWNKRATYK